MSRFTFRGISMPVNVEASLQRYVEHGVPPGNFLEAVLANDLMNACGHADEKNESLLMVIVSYVYNKMPSRCHGSYAAVEKWLKRFEPATRDQ